MHFRSFLQFWQYIKHFWRWGISLDMWNPKQGQCIISQFSYLIRPSSWQIPTVYSVLLSLLRSLATVNAPDFGSMWKYRGAESSPITSYVTLSKVSCKALLHFNKSLIVCIIPKYDIWHWMVNMYASYIQRYCSCFLDLPVQAYYLVLKCLVYIMKYPVGTWVAENTQMIKMKVHCWKPT